MVAELTILSMFGSAGSNLLIVEACVGIYPQNAEDLSGRFRISVFHLVRVVLTATRGGGSLGRNEIAIAA